MTFMRNDLKNMIQQTKGYLTSHKDLFPSDERRSGLQYGVEFSVDTFPNNYHGYCSIQGLVQWFDNEDFDYEFQVVIPPAIISVLPKDLDETKKFILNTSSEYKELFSITSHESNSDISDLFNYLDSYHHFYKLGFIIFEDFEDL